ncbi:twin-arginine translocation pathway signal protein [Labrenzia sp. CP4]|mgnify:CR=1 FL=1|jgi:isoquinoline 1-oxidoreductase beta subunit|uniref:xanthine dehydrogenase family protein molybdopterin-binding subunit n=1 Tax=Labrenzia sp. CP4 TaxID=1674922 RepID=UPI000780C82B|nr:xanthine dehydrogenase family protein molybdopterin-binding subunit [Labrenzia sp. CP4]AMN51529.1 twin-arginine translocation pathway signal protein [Labrenzia sp. CP4]
MLHLLKQPLAAAMPTRRTFLKMSAGTVGGLVLAMNLPRSTASAAEGEFIQPFVHIRPDNTVVVLSKHFDMGQGTASGLCSLVADELDASWEQVTVEFAPSNPQVYANSLFGVQGTGGSTAMANSFMQYRQAGAAAKAMIIAAAAKEWGVPAGEITVSGGVVSHDADKSATLGELAGLAANEDVPAEPTLKTPDQWVYIGKSFPRLDVKNKTVGAPRTYTMDFQRDDLLVAVVARSPRFGGKVKSFDATEAKKVPGVVNVLQIPNGVAVIAKSTWPAIKGRSLLEIEWDDAEAETRSSDAMIAELKDMTTKPGVKVREDGDVDAALEASAKVIEADYDFPFLAHGAMEPLDIAMMFDGETAEFWFASQIPTIDHNVAATVLGIPFENVKINTLWAGGSFGRRAQADAHPVVEITTLAKAMQAAGMAPAPVKIVWTREDDMAGGYYRPMSAHRLRVGLDDQGNVTAFKYNIAAKSIVKGTPFEAMLMKDGVDHNMTEGAHDTTYAFPLMNMDQSFQETKVPVLWWRSVGHTHTAYVMETMIDRLAKEAGKDPVAYRLEMIKDDPRKVGVLKLAAEKAGWDTPLPEGRHRGVAVHKSFGSFVAEVAEISFRDDGTVKVEKVTAAVDCGTPINPDNIRAQVEGGIGYGLGAILRNQVTLADGVVEETNFDTYEPIRMSDMPEIEVHIVPSNEAPTGIGEPGTPPIGPAVANAIAAAKGEWSTSLPLAKSGLV